MKLNKQFCDRENLKIGTYFDDALGGFGLRVNPGGSRVWILRFYDDNKRKRYIVVGKSRDISLREAREKALAIKTRPDKGSITVSAACDIFLQKWATNHRKTYQDDRARIDKYIKPILGTKLLGELSISDCSVLHSSIQAKIQANRTIKLLRTIINFCKKQNLFVGNNPATAVILHKEYSRERFLSKEELGKLLSVLRELQARQEYKLQAYAIELLAFTGCRKLEILSLQWKDVDLQNAQISLQTTKNGKPRVVPLLPRCVEILTQLPCMNSYVFPSESKQGHMLEIRKTWARACRLADIEHARLHDLRRTVGSLLVQDGVSLPIIAAILGHSNTYVTHVYARLNSSVERQGLCRFNELVS